MISEARLAKWPKQEDAAVALDVAWPYLWRIEKGKSAPGVRKAREIAQQLDLDWDEVRYLLRQIWESRLPPELRFPPRVQDERDLIQKFRTDKTFRDAVTKLLRKDKP